MSTVISTEALPQDSVGTTIAGQTRNHAADAFDDDEIEKAIAEIRGAIEKSSQILK
jgi:protein phosphatase